MNIVIGGDAGTGPPLVDAFLLYGAIILFSISIVSTVSILMPQAGKRALRRAGQQTARAIHVIATRLRTPRCQILPMFQRPGHLSGGRYKLEPHPFS
jgi:hypothetical protein